MCLLHRHVSASLEYQEVETCQWKAEYDIASLYMVSFYCFVTKACARRPARVAQPQAWSEGDVTVSAASYLQGQQAS